MKKYEIVKNIREIRYKDRSEICEGCTLNQDDMSPELVKPFDDKDEALEALRAYRSEIQKLSSGAGTYFHVTEYYVEENEYDENGVWLCGGYIWGFAKLPKGEKWRC